LLRHGHFSIFQDGSRPTLDFQNMEILGAEGSRRPKCVAMPNFAVIAQTVAEIWPFFDFFKMTAAGILDCQNLRILGVGRLKRVRGMIDVRYFS